MIDKVRVFHPEIEKIKTQSLKDFCIYVIKQLPDYFFSVPASSSGKYHPSYALGSGGLIRHEKAAVSFCSDIIGLEFMDEMFTREEKDLAILALIFHDGLKNGLPAASGTVVDHPIIAANFVREMAIKDNYAHITENQTEDLCCAIASHMGQWNLDYKTQKEVLPKPSTKLGKLVHLCDYLASRKHYSINFENWYNVEDFETEDAVEGSLEDMIGQIKRQAGVLQKEIGKDTIFSIIREFNGNANPNSITSIDIAGKILAKFQSVQVPENKECSE